MKKVGKFIKSVVFKIARLGKTPYISAIILAGGSSTRMGGAVKQFISIDGIPVVVRSALAFEACKDISEIVVVCRKEDEIKINDLMKEYKIEKFKSTAIGGIDRFNSMKNGFEKVNDNSDFVAIHDAARCLVTSEQISNVISAAGKSGAAIAAAHATDTIKIADNDGIIRKTIDRSTVWNAQTPQVFKKSMLEVGIYSKRTSDFSPTDDAMLVETLGFGVTPVDCGYDNIKITTVRDISVAESIILRRKSNG